MSQIVFANARRTDAELEHQLRGVSESWLQSVNRNRSAQGLPKLFPNGRPWLRSANAPRAQAQVRKASRTLPTFVLVCRMGLGNIGRSGRVEPEEFAADAFSTSHQRIRDGLDPFVLRFTHGGKAIDAVGSGTMELSPLYPDCPVCIWRPDGRDQRHVDATEMIQAGQRFLSLEFITHEAEMRDGVRFVKRATLRGVSLVLPDQAPCYRGSMAVEADVRPSHVALSVLRVVGLCRQVADGDLDATEVEAAIRRLEV